MTHKMIRLGLAGAVLATVAACGRNDETAPADAPRPARSAAADTPGAAAPSQAPDRVDVFSYANPDEIRVRHADLDLALDFETRTLSGTARLSLDYPEPGARRLHLDTNDLTITAVEAEVSGAWSPAPYILGEDDTVMGAKLTIDLPDGAEAVRIAYATSPGAEGLQWLAPEQTATKTKPFVYSQAQAINARSMLPIQDTPAIRMTFDARVRAPEGVLVVMGAAQDPDGVADGDYTFSMPQPIPPYLIAIAAGDIRFRPIGDHMGVYAEADIVDAAAAEFEDTPRMEEAAAALYGPYLWGRFDMIVLPPSFPFGGMENPRLTFLTPTLVAGDKSLVNVVAHELAHSWSGNLVTNATWRDAWLNEGFTSYVENRIMESLFGPERAVMERALDRETLNKELADLARPELSKLKLPADLRHPDEAFSQVAYVKGAFFLKFLEQRFGRDRFDPFLKSWFDAHAFKAVVTEDFLAFLDRELIAKHPGVVTAAEIDAWVHGEGAPATIEEPQSDRFATVSDWQARWILGEIEPGALPTADWTTQEWLHFIDTLPAELGIERLAALDEAFSLSEAGNAEVAFAWYMKAIAAGYEPAFEPMDAFLQRVGRGKFIYRLYTALAASDRRAWAMGVYDRARAGYHPIAQRRIDEIFEKA